MPFYLIHGDITKVKADAIVNAANPSLLGGGGVDGAIHEAAGPELRQECLSLGGCRPGEAKRTAAYRLPAKYVIHTVGPIWRGGGNGEREILASCYRSSLALAEESGCSVVAVPLISAGAYGYPYREALAVAEEEIRAFLVSRRTEENGAARPEMTVYLALWEDPAILKYGYPELRRMLEGLDRPIPAAAPQSVPKPSKIPSLLSRLKNRKKKEETSAPSAPPPGGSAAHGTVSEDAEACFPMEPTADYSRRDTEADASPRIPAPQYSRPQAGQQIRPRAEIQGQSAASKPDREEEAFFASAPYAPQQSEAHRPSSLTEALSMIDESFTEMLLRKIDERGMKDSECYRRANVDRKLFSKIRSDVHYRPSKTTAIAFAIALELSPEETDELLLKAGYALSPSSAFDVIIRYFILRGNYNVFEINEALYAFDQKQLGA